MAFSNLPAPLLHSGGKSSVFSVNSNSKSPTCFFPKNFMWGLIIEALSWSVIDPLYNLSKVDFVDLAKV